jgi:MFS family permease
MKVFSEFFLLFVIIIITSLSTLFCIIGLSTPGWHFDNYRNLFCDQCPKTPNILAIISMILLIICLILLSLLIARIIDQKQVILMRFIIPSLLGVITIFLLATLTSYLNFVDPNRGYSYYLTLMAFIFAYFASLLAAFWLGNGGFVSQTYSVEILVENR